MVLVTGGAGYIGSHVALALIDSGLRVLIFDNLETGHRETVDTLMRVKPGAAEFLLGDLRNPADVAQIFKKYKIKAVMHFASNICVEESVQNPTKYYNNNLIGSLNLVDGMIKNGVKAIVFSSSAAVYGQQKYSPMDEKHPQNPVNPYGHSKLIFEEILRRYDELCGLGSVCLRYFNVIGADKAGRIGEWHEPETHLVPNLLTASETGGLFQLYGNDYDTVDGTCVRDYINVEDLADAHMSALNYLMDGGASDSFNLGSAAGHSVGQILAACEKVTGNGVNVEIQGRRSGDPAILVADNRKAKDILKWTPKRSLEDSIDTAHRWSRRLASEIRRR
ncbi:MAG: UDP-glucose 4-epimerase GalE [Holosporaceae bacterium]|jgi:UDP-glucose 4-epimerase|nr:UDP-glucose 4-epimerase GalE [Holosporaceae bacterium]